MAKAWVKGVIGMEARVDPIYYRWTEKEMRNKKVCSLCPVEGAGSQFLISGVSGLSVAISLWRLSSTPKGGGAWSCAVGCVGYDLLLPEEGLHF